MVTITKHNEETQNMNVDGQNYDALPQITYKLVDSGDIQHIPLEEGYVNFDSYLGYIEILSWGTLPEGVDPWWVSVDIGSGTNITKFPDNFPEYFQPNGKFRFMDLSKTDFSNINTKSIKSLQSTFEDTNPNDTIRDWDVSHITDFSLCFWGCKTNPDISNWKTTSAKKMNNMFRGCSNFNADISQWDVSGVIGMDGMFSDSLSFNQDLSGWDVGNIKGIPIDFSEGASSWTLPRPIFKTTEEPYPGEGYIKYKDIYQNIKYWKIQKQNWDNHEFTDDAIAILDWGKPTEDVEGIKFNFRFLRELPDNIPKWLTNIDNLIGEGYYIYSLEPLRNWDVSHITSMVNGLKFISGVQEKNIGDVKDLLKNWDVSKVKNFSNCFRYFNGSQQILESIKDWDVSSGEDFSDMFSSARTAPPIWFWDVSNAKDMTNMFQYSSININLSSWNVKHIPEEPVGFAKFNDTWVLPKPNWGGDPSLATFKNLEVIERLKGEVICKVISDFPIPDDLTINLNVNVEQDGTFRLKTEDSFTGELELELTTNDKKYVQNVSLSLDIPPLDIGYLKYKDVKEDILTAEINFSEEGVFTLPDDVVEVLDWGVLREDQEPISDLVSIKCPSGILNVPEEIPPYITSMESMFEGCGEFNDPNVSKWDTSKIVNMKMTFKYCTSFNQDLNGWITSNVTTMEGMFHGTTDFKGGCEAWDVSNVENMKSMFELSGIES